jgi:hypothetical protein
MRIRDFLSESADLDVIYSNIVDKLRLQMYQYLYDRKDDPDFKLPIVVYKGVETPGVRIRDIIKGGPFQDVIVIFDQSDGYGNSGQAIAFKEPTNACNYAVMISAFGSSIKDIMTTLMATHSAEVFRHEFIHIMDFKRHKGPVFKREGRNGPKDDSPEESARYFNSDQELNAFYHNIAEPLLAQYRFVRKDPTTVHFYDELPDFKSYLEVLTKQLYGPKKRFWAALTAENRRRLIARLYRLYVEFQQESAKARLDVPLA